MLPRNLFEQREDFRLAVQRSNGRILLLVHPFYLRHLNRVHGYKVSVRVQRHEKAMEGINRRSNLPTVILEETPHIAATHSSLGKRNPFFVPTNLSHPRPTDGWQALHDALRQARVKTILVGGTMARLAYKGKKDKKVRRYEELLFKVPDKHITDGCAGITYAKLVKAKHGAVWLVPSLLYPHKAKYKLKRKKGKK